MLNIKAFLYPRFLISIRKELVSKIALVRIKTKPGTLLLSHSGITYTVHVTSIFRRVTSITIILNSGTIDRVSLTSYALISHQNMLICLGILLLIVFEGSSFCKMLLLRSALYVHHLTRVAIAWPFLLILLGCVMVTVHAALGFVEVIVLRRCVHSSFSLIERPTIRLQTIPQVRIN